MLPVSNFSNQGDNEYVNAARRRETMKQNAGYAKSKVSRQIYQSINNWAYKKYTRYMPTLLRSCIRVTLFPENIYNLFLFLIMTVAQDYPIFFGALLVIDLFKNSENLQNILQGLIKNMSMFLKTFILGIICIYLYAVLGFHYFNEYFMAQEYSMIYGNRLLYTFTSTLNFGMRKGGGIGEVLTQPTNSTAVYYYMAVYQIMFYMFINLFFLQILFGIIIDAFTTLRESKEESQRLVLSQCFICGIDKKIFDQQGRGWLQHIYLNHNVYNYLAFNIYLSTKNLNDCNTIEAHVKKKIMKKSLAWYPLHQAMDIIPQDD